VLTTKNGLLFIDFETCCRGPVEFDLAHAPEEVSEHYPGVNQDLLRECRILVLAMITTWGRDREFLIEVGASPYPTTVMPPRWQIGQQ
jgi:thiamine kinase-like enzyme